jgi:hypothetical protein
MGGIKKHALSSIDLQHNSRHEVEAIMRVRDRAIRAYSQVTKSVLNHTSWLLDGKATKKACLKRKQKAEKLVARSIPLQEKRKEY